MFNLVDFKTTIQNPKDIKFEAQNADENIVLLLRRDFITNSGWITLTILLLLLPTFLPALFGSFNIRIQDFVSPTQLLLIRLFYYLFVFGYAFEQFLIWYFSVDLVTNKRILDIDFVGLLYKQVNETELSNVQEVKHDQGGAFEVIFDYGDVSIQTEAPELRIFFEKVPNPSFVRQTIIKLAQQNGGGE